MKHTIELQGITFELSARLATEGVPFPNHNKGRFGRLLHNHYRITVRVNRNSITFDFYDSNANYEAGKKALTDKELVWAFQCFVSDALCTDRGYEEFCSELGYDIDSREALRIYQLCKKSMAKLNSLDLPCDHYDLVNELIEIENAG